MPDKHQQSSYLTMWQWQQSSIRAPLPSQRIHLAHLTPQTIRDLFHGHQLIAGEHHFHQFSHLKSLHFVENVAQFFAAEKRMLSSRKGGGQASPHPLENRAIARSLTPKKNLKNLGRQKASRRHFLWLRLCL